MAKKLILDPIWAHLTQIWSELWKMVKNVILACWAQIRAHTQKKFLRKLSDRRMDRRTRESDFIKRFPTHVEHPIKKTNIQKVLHK